ncbi:rhodanese-like domain-containing protein [Ascidiaceihabitans sp.]|uniref:rhodanese-like domain-containing protein n=1 Tax=Ascidiaceihabitans sp. TaxID=1872644 RepID=UPI003298FCB6
MKTSKDYMEDANAVVPRIDSADAVAKHGDAACVFVDVRDSAAIAQTGTIAGAHHIPRGMLEFIADPATGAYNPALTKDAPIYLICAAGGQAALAGKTLTDMGYTNVTNIGGISGWKDAGGPIESA